MTQAQKEATKTAEVYEEDEAVEPKVPDQEHIKELDEETEALLADIDDLIDELGETFAQEFVQQGGQ